MSTAPSWTERPGGRSGPADRLVDPVRDLAALVRFRSSGLGARGRDRMRVAAAGAILLTLAAAVVPAHLPGAATYAGHDTVAGRLVTALPAIYLGFVLLAVLTATASGGGRELVAREQAVVWPISPTTDHLAALLLAPVNIAWLLEAWTLIGLTTFLTGSHLLPLAVVVVLVFLVLATACGQLVAWTLEGVRRGPAGGLLVGGLGLALGVVLAVLVLTDRLAPVLDRSPTRPVLRLALEGPAPTWLHYALPLALLVLLTGVVVLAGAVPAGWALRRAPRGEHRLESGAYRARPDPSTDLRALVRVDRAGVWRSAPLRRGMVVLALVPGAVAFVGDLQFSDLAVLPGLVASGTALLFGVNGWCLDGRGGLWRESLPHAATLAFRSRLWVLAEVLLATMVLSLLLAGVRAGLPTPTEVVALLACLVTVGGQVLSASMRWSVRRPYASDMRSARATPAPPAVLVGYSARLALATTFVGALFSALAALPVWWPSLLLAVPLVAVSTWRIARVERAWADPDVRARVVVTVAG